MLPVKFTLLEGGHCHQLEAMAIRGGRWKICQFASLFGLIQHPRFGNMLYDTGYTPRFYEETRRFPYKFYAYTTPVYIQEKETAKFQLAQLNIAAEDIRYIFISHFHADHIGGLKDFPNAKLICFSAAYAAVKNKQGFQACRHGFIPNLLPNDFLARVIFVDKKPLIKLSEEYYPFTVGYDIFRDDSLIAVDLSGHVMGQMGLLLSTQAKRKVFLIADACWSSRAYRDNCAPHPITRLIHKHNKLYRNTLSELHELYKENKELIMIPSHCAEIRQQLNELNQGVL